MGILAKSLWPHNKLQAHKHTHAQLMTNIINIAHTPRIPPERSARGACHTYTLSIQSTTIHSVAARKSKTEFKEDLVCQTIYIHRITVSVYVLQLLNHWRRQLMSTCLSPGHKAKHLARSQSATINNSRWSTINASHSTIAAQCSALAFCVLRSPADPTLNWNVNLEIISYAVIIINHTQS